MLCSKCNAALADGANFCHVCGAKQVKKNVCSACGAELIEGARFCFSCGAAVSAAPSPASAPVPKSVPAPKPASAPKPAPIANTAPKTNSEPFFKTWIAEHKEKAESLNIAWISTFKGDYAVAILNNKNCAVVKQTHDESEYIILLTDSDSFDELSTKRVGNNGVLGSNCFGNGMKYLALAVSYSGSGRKLPEYAEDMILSFTGKPRRVVTGCNCDNDYCLCFLIDYLGNFVISDRGGCSINRSDTIKLLSDDLLIKMNLEEFDKGYANGKLILRYSIFKTDGTVVLPTIYCSESIGSSQYGKHDFLLFSTDYKEEYGRRQYCIEKSCVLNYRTGKLYMADGNSSYSLFHARPCREDDESDTGYYILKKSDIDVSNEDKPFVPTIIDGDDKVIAVLDRCSHISGTLKLRDYLYISTFLEKNDDIVSYIYKIYNTVWAQNSVTKACLKGVGLSIEQLIEQSNSVFVVACDRESLFVLNQTLDVVFQIQGGKTCHVLNGEIYVCGSERDQLGNWCDTLTNLNTGERFIISTGRDLIIEADTNPASLDDTSLLYVHGDRFVYSLGSITAFGEPYFLVGDSNELRTCSIRKGGCGLVDKHGRYIIPYSNDILFITQRDYLPANTFYACCIGGIRKVYDVNGTLIAQGRYSSDGRINELRDNFEGCKVR